MSGFRFVLRPESFCIHRLPSDQALDYGRLAGATWYSITRTDDEVSVVAPEGIDLGPGKRETGWKCLRIQGTLDLATVGVLAGVSKALADANISIFAISTYNTDYFLVKKSDVAAAKRALTAAGHQVFS